MFLSSPEIYLAGVRSDIVCPVSTVNSKYYPKYLFEDTRTLHCLDYVGWLTDMSQLAGPAWPRADQQQLQTSYCGAEGDLTSWVRLVIAVTLLNTAHR